MPRSLWHTSESWVRRVVMGPLWLAEGPYRLGALLHRTLYDRGLLRRVKLDAVVVSVGNLTVGGSGKTPLVAWLAAELFARGRAVAVLSRGVRGRRSGQTNVVSDGERVLLSPRDVGDEPVWLAGAAPGVPVFAGRNRVALGLRATSVFGAEILLLDDGFQHHRVARDVDLVCVDGQIGLGNRHVLPRGPLREAARGLRRAHAIVFTRAPAAPDPLPPLPEALPETPQFRLELTPRGLRPLGRRGLEPLEALRGLKVGVLAALARPDRFERQLAGLGAEVADRRLFPDHYRYSRRDIETLDPALHWITTAKDAVKLPSSWASDLSLSVLEEQVVPLPELIELVLERVERARGFA